MKVDIYITSQFMGRVTKGRGVYGIVLVTQINGKKYANCLLYTSLVLSSPAEWAKWHCRTRTGLASY